MLARSLILKTSALRPVEKLVRKSFLFRPLVRRFIAGDTLEEAIKVAEDLMARGFKVSLDYLGENTQSEPEALAAKQTYVEMLHRIGSSIGFQSTSSSTFQAGDQIEPCNISIKLTQCGMDQGIEVAEKNYREVLEVARDTGNFVRVDMESSEYTDRTIEIVERAIQDGANTGTVLQSYLHRTDADVEKMIGLRARTRLVKGAYLEPEGVALQEKRKVDEAYVHQAKRLLEASRYPAIATHDERIITQVEAFVSQEGIGAERFEYQMLFGIRRDLQDRLRAQGRNVRVYVPFGDAWYPYFTRRLAERPANALFILKSIFKG